MNNDKNKLKKIIIFIVTIIALSSTGLSIYQNIRINKYKASLKNTIKGHIELFVSRLEDMNDETVYAEQYASITAARYAYLTLSQGEKITTSTWFNGSLSEVLYEIKSMMTYDREKLKESFDGTNGSELLLKIADDCEDKESIEKLLKILK